MARWRGRRTPGCGQIRDGGVMETMAASTSFSSLPLSLDGQGTRRRMAVNALDAARGVTMQPGTVLAVSTLLGLNFQGTDADAWPI